MQINAPKYFLAANSCEGFYSAFTKNYDASDGWRAFLIKGGPGTGKSSLMKYIAVKADDRGLKTELCPCSSDPDSLDGVIIPEIKTVVFDATSPHTAEPSYPAACEEIINLGEYWDSEKLYAQRNDIIAATDRCSMLHKTAKRYISAAGQLISDNLKLQSDCIYREKISAFSESLCRRTFKTSTNRNSREWVRFIEGITPKGIVCYGKTVTENYENTIIIDDDYGFIAGEIMNFVRNRALRAGYDIITLKSPFLPDTLTDHILIPELSLAFVSENEYMKFDTDARRIHARRFTDIQKFRLHRNRMLFNRRIERDLLLSAAKTLKQAKTAHDELERFYVSAMDFDRLSKAAPNLEKRIFH